jgi:pimeloyl-ACP methyl ester carboxylesterase
MLEIIVRGQSTNDHPVPLLFVHGGWHAAWCWDENFLNFFADKGFLAAAVSLRGHGESAGTYTRNARSIGAPVRQSVQRS